MQVVGKDQYGQGVKFTTPFYVDDKEYPTQMIVIDKMGGKISTFGRGKNSSGGILSPPEILEPIRRVPVISHRVCPQVRTAVDQQRGAAPSGT